MAGPGKIAEAPVCSLKDRFSVVVPFALSGFGISSDAYGLHPTLSRSIVRRIG
jgi:hypothetical protein